MSDFGVLNLDAIRQLDEKSSDLFFSIVTSSLDEMVSVIESSEAIERGLSEEQVADINTFYTKVLDLFLEKEMYEECLKVKKLLEYLEENYKKS